MGTIAWGSGDGTARYRIRWAKSRTSRGRPSRKTMTISRGSFHHAGAWLRRDTTATCSKNHVCPKVWTGLDVSLGGQCESSRNQCFSGYASCPHRTNRRDAHISTPPRWTATRGATKTNVAQHAGRNVPSSEVESCRERPIWLILASLRSNTARTPSKLGQTSPNCHRRRPKFCWSSADWGPSSANFGSFGQVGARPGSMSTVSNPEVAESA